MSVHLISQQQKITHDEEIKEGLYYCPKCKVIMSSYYLRTYSINCLRTANFARCTKCSGKARTHTKETRLTRENLCAECGQEPNSFWGGICFEPLVKMTPDDFVNFCLVSMKKRKSKFAISKETVLMLFDELSKKDFISNRRTGEAGLDYSQIVNLMREARERLIPRNTSRIASR